METNPSKKTVTFNAKNLANFAKLKVSIILPYFNEELGLELMENAKEELLKNNVKEENVNLIRVAGALETPFAALRNAEKSDVIIILGVVIRGETSHYELVTETTFQGLMQAQLQSKTPMIFGILACENSQQAKARASKNGLNKGKEAAIAALIQSTL